MANEDELDDKPGKMSMTWIDGKLRAVTASFPDDSYSMEIGLADGQESISTRRDGEIETKASPVTAGDDHAEVHAAEMLRLHLNNQADEDVWFEAAKVDDEREEGRDVVLRSATRDPMYLQVVSADVNQKRWKYYRGTPSGSFVGEDELDVEQAAGRIIAAVGLKEDRYDPATKRGLVLLLDARAVPEASDPAVQAEVRANVGRSLFAEIYVAGLTEFQVWKAR